MNSTFSAQVRILTARVKAAAISFGSVKASAIAASVNATLITVSAAIGRFLIFLEKADQAGVADLPSLGLVKPLKDLMGALDAARVTFGKGATDGSRLSDASARAVIKGLSDTVRFSEATPKALSKVLKDTTAILDLYAALLTKPLSESPRVTDSKALTSQKNVNELMALVDAATRSFGKTMTEATGVVDLATRALSKNLTEALFVTDDIDGQASILDDQTVAFFKSRSDLFSVIDEIAVQVKFVRSFDEATTFSDGNFLDSIKGLSENPTLTDKFTRLITYGRLFDETPTVDSRAALGFSMVQDDVYMEGHDYFAQDYVEDGDKYFVSDVCRPLMNKMPYETLHFSDQINSRSIGKGLSDTGQFSDLRSFSASKFFTDGFTATDDFDGAASTLDDEIMSFVKARADQMSVSDAYAYVAQFRRSPADSSSFTDAANRQCGKAYSDAASVLEQRAMSLARATSDTFGATDAPSKAPNKVKTDQATFTDAGSLRSQGYCDFTFFAEDFVGASRTF